MNPQLTDWYKYECWLLNLQNYCIWLEIIILANVDGWSVQKSVLSEHELKKPLEITKFQHCKLTQDSSWFNSPGVWGVNFSRQLWPSKTFLKVKCYVWLYEKIMSPKFLLHTHVYFTDQKNTEYKYIKTVISHYMTTYSPDNGLH